MNLTQVELADLCEMDSAHISRIEGGYVNLSLDNLARIASALRQQPSWLLDKAGM